MAAAAPAQLVNTIATFTRTGGNTPFAPLVQGANGDLYGTTAGGYPGTWGTVFEITPEGKLNELYNFCKQSGCADGAYPYAPVVLGTDGSLYGTTKSGGAHNYGTVFRLANGKLTTLYSFCTSVNCADGAYPLAGLVEGSDGNFYGTTSVGGPIGNGTVFKITPQGALTTLYTFCALPNCADGWQPYAGLMQATDGNFYGTTLFGGAGTVCGSGGCGTIFKITSHGQLTTLHSFCAESACADGSYPFGGLIQGKDGNFYGTVEQGPGNYFGAVFRLTPSGEFTTLVAFCGLGPAADCSDSALPSAGLVQGTDGNVYGTTFEGGSSLCSQIAYVYGCGTAFGMTPDGSLTLHYEFCSHQPGCADGALLNAPLMQATDGSFYGTTQIGGGGAGCFAGCGTVFSFSMGLGPFVMTHPSLGSAGMQVIILGNHLTGSTKVSFNGTAASFRVVSETEIVATVPAGVTSGIVSVSTSTSTLTSNIPFTVTR